MIKLITDKKHRFNKQVLIGNKDVFINSNGEIEVEESLVTTALDVGFELVDKDVKFTSKEEAAKIKDVVDTLNSAKATAKEIIEEAKKEAEKIINEAQKRAEALLVNNGVGEKEEFLKKIQAMKVPELKEILVSSDKYSEEDLKVMKKEDLINAIMKIKYSEE